MLFTLEKANFFFIGDAIKRNDQTDVDCCSLLLYFCSHGAFITTLKTVSNYKQMYFKYKEYKIITIINATMHFLIVTSACTYTRALRTNPAPIVFKFVSLKRAMISGTLLNFVFTKYTIMF